MRVALVWPIGPLHPGEVHDVVPELGAVLCREGFARPAEGPPIDPEPAAPTVAELKAYAQAHGLSVTTARHRIAAELAARREGAT